MNIIEQIRRTVLGAGKPFYLYIYGQYAKSVFIQNSDVKPNFRGVQQPEYEALK